MSVQDQLTRLESAKATLAAAITGKGVAVPDNAKLDAYSSLVDQISTSGGGGSGVRTCRLVIGTSTAGWTQSDCDVLCTGRDDDMAINNAIQSVSGMGGGEIVLLSGTYIASTPIMVQSPNITIRGNGPSTVIQRGYRATDSDPTGYISVSGNNCGLYGLVFDGHDSVHTSGIYTINVVVSGSNFVLSHCSVTDVKGNSLDLRNNGSTIVYSDLSGFVGVNSRGSNHTLIGNKCMDCSEYGINAASGSLLIGNNCNDSGKGINIYGENITITGNSCCSCSYGIFGEAAVNCVISDNVCDQSEIGILLAAGDSITCTGNRCKDFSQFGIGIAEISNCHIAGNVCYRGNGTPSDYSSDQHTIWLMSGSNNSIANNYVKGKGVTNNSSGANVIKENDTFIQESGGSGS